MHQEGPNKGPQLVLLVLLVRGSEDSLERGDRRVGRRLLPERRLLRRWVGGGEITDAGQPNAGDMLVQECERSRDQVCSTGHPGNDRKRHKRPPSRAASGRPRRGTAVSPYYLWDKTQVPS